MLHNIVDAMLAWLEQTGYWGIMLGLMLEVIPSEIVLSYGGYLVSQGSIKFELAVLFGTVGGTIAQIFVYWIGRYGGRPFLEKYGKFLLINKHHIDVAERWFNRYGTGVIFTARFIPVVRHAISIPAGIARMPIGRFTLLTALAVIPWSVLFIWLGFTLGDQWENIDQAAGQYVKPAMFIAAVLLAVYIAWKWAHSRNTQRNAAMKAAGIRNAEEQGKQEDIIAQQLRSLGREYVLFHGIKLRSGESVQEFSHIAIGTNGVFHLEPSVWSGDVAFQGQDILHNGIPVKDPTPQLYRHEYVLKEVVRSVGVDSEVTGVLVFTHPTVRLRGKIPSFATVRSDMLEQLIKNHHGRKSLNSDDVQRVAAAICKHSVTD